MNHYVPPYPLFPYEIDRIKAVWCSLACSHFMCKEDAVLAERDLDLLVPVYYHYKKLFHFENCISDEDLEKLMHIYHFDLILELYLYQRYGHLFGSFFPEDEMDFPT